MSSPFFAEIRMFAGNFAPVGWALCNGQLLQINQNTALYTLLGTTYGGDGRTTFGLPNLKDSIPIGNGDGPATSPRVVGETGGAPDVALSQVELAAHTHNFGGSGNQGDQPVGKPANVLAQSSPGQAYQTVSGANAPLTQFHPDMLTHAGSGVPHNNMMPFLAVTFIIALQGVFPGRP